MFDYYIGIDYSGAETPTSRLKGLKLCMANRNLEPAIVTTPTLGAKNWTRKEIAQWCAEKLADDERGIIGIDHGFSFPVTYMQRYGLENWDQFLGDFLTHWPTADDHTYVDFLIEDNQRIGDSSEFRLCEKWTSSTKSVFQLDGQGTVGKSTHAGIPWLLYLREDPRLRDKLHFWPFDGFEIHTDKSVIAEVYPSIFRRRYPREDRTLDEHDAWCIAAWMKSMDSSGALARYFKPPLTLAERRQCRLEGWILGVW
ncbi:MAG: hypothetical protein OES26_00190 [Gammaproteobacteria bacterium]|nr:hypothetical protein [Gammaproteobacteria bacterium]